MLPTIEFRSTVETITTPYPWSVKKPIGMATSVNARPDLANNSHPSEMTARNVQLAFGTHGLAPFVQWLAHS